ncbi:Nucleolar pre-ribosomal-associated 1 [Gossypium arboreum]|uniref:Nucleolar pre-ribosomal-associated 1 n=2 Tax=Gossypium TaxID=3633 RepID=A0A0B0P750_GOSAR|nr:uncharacterized protein LOC107935004 [Gossypium hirsutum]XP_017632401.1 uncharacterized protein LOC108474877 isoform X1 [Gossypium arboreum]KHG19959.1 Nucleolar pre-ribosomal-associated 1 [Gossypium arboreum]
MTLCSAAPADSCDIMGCSRLHHLHLQEKAAQLHFLFQEKLWCPMMESTSTQEVIQTSLTNQQGIQGSIPYISSATTAWVAVPLRCQIRTWWMKTKEKKPAMSGAKSLKMMAVLDASSHGQVKSGYNRELNLQ